MISDLKDDDFSVVYKSLLDLFPDRPWLRYVGSLEHQLRETPLMRSFLWRKNLIAYGLCEYERYGVRPPSAESWDAIKSAMIFASQVVFLGHVASSTGNLEGRRKLIGRVRHAIKKPDGMRGMRLELLVATHLSRQGCEIQWMEEDVGLGTFDLLAGVPGAGFVEVECKSISADRGEALTEEEFHLLVDPILHIIQPRLREVERHFFAIDITFLSRPPRGRALEPFIEKIVDAVFRARSDEGVYEMPGVCQVRVVLSDLRNEVAEGEALTCDEACGVADHLLGLGQGFRFIKSFGDECYLSIDFRTSVPSKFETMLGEVAKVAVRCQLTGTRPGCLVVGVERHSGASLAEFAHEEFDVLALRATKLLRGNPHLASVVFVSAPSFERVENVAGGWDAAVGARAHEGAEEKLVSEGELSRTYVFDNPEGHYPHLRLSQLFGVT
ncbi:hypothetical protein [Pseudomonas hunanensis]|uniref:hypothetical protein n=1 Tax=Pseudomonas hunanensis TaxID=1247546 RepID=UPI0030DA1F39